MLLCKGPRSTAKNVEQWFLTSPLVERWWMLNVSMHPRIFETRLGAELYYATSPAYHIVLWKDQGPK